MILQPSRPPENFLINAQGYFLPIKTIRGGDLIIGRNSFEFKEEKSGRFFYHKPPILHSSPSLSKQRCKVEIWPSALPSDQRYTLSELRFTVPIHIYICVCIHYTVCGRVELWRGEAWGIKYLNDVYDAIVSWGQRPIGSFSLSLQAGFRLRHRST